MKHLITITVMLVIALCASCDKKGNNDDENGNNSSNGSSTTVTKKYVVGNFYNENGVQGIVYKITDKDSLHGMIISLDEISNCKWIADTTLEKVETRATDGNNGMDNMDTIKMLNIDDYPAFKWCDSKNTNSVTGWYLPALNELDEIYRVYANTALSFSDSIKTNGGTDFSPLIYWSSTEVPPPSKPISAQTIDFNNGHSDNTPKRTPLSVRAVRAF
ncbi:MAG: DUF1566 domain-containing protein [Bacteroidales bacterium]|jgi:hypothetical protein|nr:DUF1566 domain-containing protein [Bacteroidales bacterium]